jgi:hypothetical protein
MRGSPEGYWVFLTRSDRYDIQAMMRHMKNVVLNDLFCENLVQPKRTFSLGTKIAQIQFRRAAKRISVFVQAVEN